MMRDELLDDTINRVASDMTAGGSNAMLSAVVRRRIVERRRWPSAVAPLALATAVAVMTTVVTQWLASPPARDGRQSELPSIEARWLAPIVPLAAGVAPSPLTERVVSRPTPPLGIAPLSIAPLTIAILRDVEPVRMDDIRIAEMPTMELKEPR